MIIIEIAGNLGADVETRMTPTGQKVSTMRVACRVKRSGRDETIWWRVTMWGDRFERLFPYLKKGSSVIVIGEMIKTPELYQSKDGSQRVSLEMTAEIVRFSPFGGGGTSRSEGEQTQQSSSQHEPVYAAASSSVDDGDDLPF